MQPILDHTAALETCLSDMKELVAIHERLVTSYADKTKKAQRLKASALKGALGEINTVAAQLDKVHASINEARNRYEVAVDDVNAGTVERFEGLLAYGIATGQPSAAARYLYGSCKAFRDAKGNLARRQALYAQFSADVEAVINAIAPEAPAGPTILDDYESIKDDEAKSRFYAAHKLEIMAAHDTQKFKDINTNDKNTDTTSI